MAEDLDTPPSADATAAARPWWRSGLCLLSLGFALPVLGLQFVGLIACVLLLSDPTRDRWLRLGGTIAIFGWTWTFALAGAPPIARAVLFGLAAPLLLVGARNSRAVPREALGGAGLALAGALLAVVALVPYGVREPAVDADEAIALVTAARATEPSLAATQLSVDGFRNQLTSRPYYDVLLYEANPTQATTADDEPCFRRAQTWRVDRVNRKTTFTGIAEARSEDGGCLPVKKGTRRHLRPVPSSAS